MENLKVLPFIIVRVELSWVEKKKTKWIQEKEDWIGRKNLMGKVYDTKIRWGQQIQSKSQLFFHTSSLLLRPHQNLHTKFSWNESMTTLTRKFMSFVFGCQCDNKLNSLEKFILASFFPLLLLFDARGNFFLARERERKAKSNWKFQ